MSFTQEQVDAAIESLSSTDDWYAVDGWTFDEVKSFVSAIVSHLNMLEELAAEKWTEMGVEAGSNAASWVYIDSEAIALDILKKYNEGDPAVMNMCPSPLSGEMAGESMQELLGEHYANGEVQAQYEDAFHDAFWDSIQARCYAHIDKCKHCGVPVFVDDDVLRHFFHEGETCGEASPDTYAEVESPQIKRIKAMCAGWNVEYVPEHWAPAFDLPKGWLTNIKGIGAYPAYGMGVDLEGNVTT